MMKWLALLRLFLFLGVEGEDEPTGGEPAADGAGGEEDPSGAGDPDPEPAPRETPKETAARLRAERAERELDEERNARRAPAAPARPDPVFEQEERQLQDARASGNADTLRWTEWQVNNNRIIRQSKQESSAALSEARDLADRAAFDRKAASNPRMAKYADKVEEAVAKLRSSGQATAPRAEIAAYLIGKDLMDGKFKPKTAKPAATPNAPNVHSINRGRSPNVRTDVSGRGGAGSEHQKRTERLRGKII